MTLGVGIFTFDPYTYYDGTKVFLRPLGTEGQTGGYLGRKEYNTMAICIPFGVGIKYSITEKVNLTFEVSQRFTTDPITSMMSVRVLPKDRLRMDPTARH